MSDANDMGFSGHLFVDGFPLLLSYQIMEQRLLRPRITTDERLVAEIHLNDESKAGVLTLADYDDADPLLLEFAPAGKGQYALIIKTAGRYLNWRVKITEDSRVLRVDKNFGSLFELNTYAGKLKSLADLPSNPASVTLVSVEKGIGVFLNEAFGLKFFQDKSPNATGHDAFNATPVNLVLRTRLSAYSAVA